MLDVYCKIDGIDGESKDDQHKNWIEVLSFNHGITQTASASKSTAGGGTAERTDHQDFTITKAMDKTSPKLYEYCSSGKHITSVTLDFMRADGGSRVKYMEVKIEEVIISSVSPGGSKGSDFPAESVSLNYGKIKWTYTEQKRADGTGGGNVPGGWDLTANKAYA